MSALSLVRAPFLTAFLLVFAVLLLAGSAVPTARFRAYAERHDQPFDEARQRKRRLASGALGVVLLVLAIGVTLI